MGRAELLDKVLGSRNHDFKVLIGGQRRFDALENNVYGLVAAHGIYANSNSCHDVKPLTVSASS